MHLTARLDFLQRAGAPLRPHAGAVTEVAPDRRRMARIRGIGREGERPKPPPSQGAWRPPSSGVLAGLATYRIPLAFGVRSESHGVQVAIGTWAAGGAGRAERRAGVLQHVLGSVYSGLRAAPDETPGDLPPLGGLVLGVPAPEPPSADDPALPWDRLLRALAGPDRWAVAILAQPLAEDTLSALRQGVLNELREVQDAARSELAAPAVAEFYAELLKRRLAGLSDALATGGWRVACYLLGDATSYPSLAGTWRGVFAGPGSAPEPLRVFDEPLAREWAARWALPEDPGPPSPGSVRRPFEYQTILSSAQLAAYAHLPSVEMPGFQIDAMPRFDVVAPEPAAGEELVLGDVVHGHRPTALPYRVATRSLTRHALVCGVTGSGKSTTIFRLLDRLWAAGVPFLVVEPAKAEYRALLDHERIGPALQVFTLGDETIAPIRLNPFEVPEGVRVSEHLDALRAIIAGSFGMWAPLPQVLERCLHEIYADRGWDVASDVNRRLDGQERSRAAPTLTDLAAKIDAVVASLGYDDKIRGDITAALLTRVNSLRTGGKGAMLDVERSLPVDALLERPTVLELEPLGDDDDKAMLMGLVLLRIVQRRRAQGVRDALAHVLVVEEAHRLLSAGHGARGEEQGDARRRAVEMFSNLLSEIRAYGQGVLIADQIPVRLAPDVLKNTGLKIAHRTVAAEDRQALAGAMAMSEEQSRALTNLPAGRAAVFGSGDDAPILVQVPDAGKERLLRDRPPDARLRVEDPPGCPCGAGGAECRTARGMVDEPALSACLSRILLSAVEDDGAIGRQSDDLTGLVSARAPAGLDHDALLRAVRWHGADAFAERLGAPAGWTYGLTDAVAAAARGALLEGSRGEYRTVAGEALTRDRDPYPACAAICGARRCVYRHAVAGVVGRPGMRDRWQAAEAADAGAGTEAPARRQAWGLCQEVAFDLVEWPEPEMDALLAQALHARARRAGLCFAQQMLGADDHRIPRTQRWILRQLIEEAQRP
jgi:hypothetical protein